jgi:hypothetical protein
VDAAGCFLQGDVGTKVKTPGAGKNIVGEALQVPTMERLYKLHYFPVQGSCLVPNSRVSPHSGNCFLSCAEIFFFLSKVEEFIDIEK